MTATLVEDAQLCKDLGVAPEAIERALLPTTYGDIGERMILAPRLVGPEITLDQVAGLAQQLSGEGYSVVVLVPSFERGKPWARFGARVANRKDVDDVVDGLRSGREKFVVLANRYDGIDLPDNACRVLILDGLPHGTSMSESYSALARGSSKLAKAATVQRIEQGLGRAVRSATDYAAVLLIGDDLVNFVSQRDSMDMLSAETRSQVDMCLEISRSLQKDGRRDIAAVEETVRKCLSRNPGWLRYHQARLSRAQPSEGNTDMRELAVRERAAFRMFAAHRDHEADAALQEAMDRVPLDEADRGWYCQLRAKYLWRTNPERAQELQLAAHDYNTHLLKPLGGVKPKSLRRKHGAQAQRVLDWVRNCNSATAVVVKVNGVLADMQFGVAGSKAEAAYAEMGRLLGFDGWRPEAEYRVGPDDMWEVPAGPVMLLELKTEVFESRDWISKKEIAQLSVSANWFAQSYPGEAVIPVLVHPSRVLSDQAFGPQGVMILDSEALAKLAAAIRAFAATIAAREPDAHSAESIDQALSAHRLNGASITTFLAHPRRVRA